MRTLGLGIVLIAALAGPAAAWQGGGDAKDASSGCLTAEREAAALAFVKRHHAELAKLLDRLKGMNRAEYEKAMLDLSRVGERLEAQRGRDPRRYELGLEAWKARSRAELLAAQLAGSKKADDERRLRKAVEHQMKVELQQLRLERELAQARLARLEDSIAKFERDRDELVESRYQAMARKGRRAEAKSKTRVKPKGDASEVGAGGSKANPKSKADEPGPKGAGGDRPKSGRAEQPEDRAGGAGAPEGVSKPAAGSNEGGSKR